ncbi:transcriptional regulator, y4mF family [Hydrogenophaga intermedia]|uniref:Transcriptional regulator, y4mF family n=2 Tax=Hydrogenophaga intermedia TaxID=65786 RepID=A0A1L1PEY1_HYDIT|nr:transcriptional regulator, y4mF family [Hydrogenophaga intermedia]
MESLSKKFARRLREIMNTTMALDTQTKVAEAADIGQASVARILHGKQSATLDMVEAIAHACGVKNAAYFLLDEAELRLLQQWHALGASDREAVLGYMAFKGQSVTKGVTQILDFARDQQSVPRELQPAVSRASRRSLLLRPNSTDAGKEATPHGTKAKAPKRKSGASR